MHRLFSVPQYLTITNTLPLPLLLILILLLHLLLLLLLLLHLIHRNLPTQIAIEAQATNNNNNNTTTTLSVSDTATSTLPEEDENASEESSFLQPLHQLITAFSRSASTDESDLLSSDFLYYSFANIMSQVYTPLSHDSMYICIYV